MHYAKQTLFRLLYPSSREQWNMSEENCGGTELLSLSDAARRLSASIWTLRAHQKRGNLRVVRIGRRVMLSCAELLRVAKDGLPALPSGDQKQSERKAE